MLRCVQRIFKEVEDKAAFFNHTRKLSLPLGRKTATISSVINFCLILRSSATEMRAKQSSTKEKPSQAKRSQRRKTSLTTKGKTHLHVQTSGRGVKRSADQSCSSTETKTSFVKNPDVSGQSSNAKKRRSANLTWCLKVYKGLEDWHIPIFRATETYTHASRVLYPGSDKHVTASLVFPDVLYVDFNSKLGPVFSDSVVLDWIKGNKFYSGEMKIKFMAKNFESSFTQKNSFDLLISSCAGIVSSKCAKYLKVGGYFLVSDAHSDARTTFLNKDFELVGVFDDKTGELSTDAEELNKHFRTKAGSVITPEQVEESVQKPRSRRSFKMLKESMFYLFKKIK